jgi:hypothetical protein
MFRTFSRSRRGHRQGATGVAGRGLKRYFTILENTFAVAAFGLVMSGSYTVISQAGYLVHQSVDHYLAATCALSRLERMRSVPLADLPLFAEDGVRLDANGMPDPGGNFRRSISVSQVNDKLSLVTVRIDIRDRKTGRFEGDHESVAVKVAELK